MFGGIGTEHLDFKRGNLCVCGNVEPGFPGDWYRIDRICDHGEADAKVILGERIRHPITGITDFLVSTLSAANRLLDGVNAQVNSRNAAGQFARYCRLAHPG